MNIQFHANESDVIKLATKLQCTTDKISKVIKASLLERKTSPYFRELEKRQEEGKEEEMDFLKELEIAVRWLKICNEEPRMVSCLRENYVDESKYAKFKKEALEFCDENEKMKRQYG